MKSDRRYSVICSLSAAFLMLLFVFTACEKDDTSGYYEGTGSEEDPFLIETPEQLYNVRNNPDKHFRQIADVNLINYAEGAGWTPIGDKENRFTGTYRGDGYKIVNLSIDRPDENYVGGLAGVNEGDITNTYAATEVTAQLYLGGLIGENRKIVKKSYAVGEVSPEGVYVGYIGGLIGGCDGVVTDNYFDKNTTDQDDDEGKGVPKSTLEMQQESTYVNWDFDNIWAIDEIHMSYPYLQWEE